MSCDRKSLWWMNERKYTFPQKTYLCNNEVLKANTASCLIPPSHFIWEIWFFQNCKCPMIWKDWLISQLVTKNISANHRGCLSVDFNFTSPFLLYMEILFLEISWLKLIANWWRTDKNISKCIPWVRIAWELTIICMETVENGKNDDGVDHWWYHETCY